MKPFLIGIAGPSCSGKTTIARKIVETNDGVLVQLDDYFRKLDEFPQKLGYIDFEVS